MIPWLWGLAVLATFGVAAPFLFVYAGRRAHRRGWVAIGVLYGALIVGAFLLAAVAAEDSSLESIAGVMLLAAWAGGTVHAFMARREFERLIASPGRRALERARDAIAERAEAQRLAADEPAVAKELGVGRPDIRGARHMGVIDVNNAKPAVLAQLPGVTRARAREIAHAREEIDGFSSLADMGMALHLDGDTVEDLRPYAVFLPR